MSASPVLPPCVEISEWAKSGLAGHCSKNVAPILSLRLMKRGNSARKDCQNRASNTPVVDSALFKHTLNGKHSQSVSQSIANLAMYSSLSSVEFKSAHSEVPE